MPLYATLCSSCAQPGTVFRRVADRDNLPLCSCGGRVDRIITAPYISPDIEPYVSPASGRVISSREQRKDEMERLGFRTYEPGVERDIENNRKRAQEKALEPIHKSVDDLVTSLNVAGKLENINV